MLFKLLQACVCSVLVLKMRVACACDVYGKFVHVSGSVFKTCVQVLHANGVHACTLMSTCRENGRACLFTGMPALTH